MKKYLSIILAVAAVVLNFLCFWYSDTLFNRFFVLGLVPIGLSLLLLPASVAVAIVSIVRHRRGAVSYIALALAVITVVILFVFPFRTAKVNFEMELYENKRLEVVEMIKNGELAIDDLGNAKLPVGYANISSDGYVFVYQNDDEQVISFWVYRGMLSGSVEVVYSSGDESLIYKNETGHPIADIQELKEHWYLVDTDY